MNASRLRARPSRLGRALLRRTLGELAKADPPNAKGRPAMSVRF